MLIKEIKNRIKAYVQNCNIEIFDESHLHLNHNNRTHGRAHLKAIIISEYFKGMSLIERHKMIYSILGDDIGKTIHAFSMQVFTPEESKLKNKKTE